jgi:hypothetical protein
MAHASDFRTCLKIAAIGATVVLVFSVSRGPRQPAIEAPAQAVETESAALFPRLVGEAEAARSSDTAGPVTIGPDEAIRMHGGSVVTDFFSQ